MKKQPLDEKTAYRKQLRYQEANSAMIKTRLDDSLGRIPWSNNHENVASYVDGTGGVSQQRLLAIMNQLTNDIRVNGRRITPLQTQMVQQTNDGDINPTSPASNMQDEMQPDMQTSMHDDMQSNTNDMGNNEVKPIQIPINQKGGDGAPDANGPGDGANGPGMFERLMFGGLSQIVGGGKGSNSYSETGGGMTNVPGLSYGGSNNNGVINLMESEHGLKPMRGMNGMGSINGMNGMMTGMHGMMNGMGMMMPGTGRMRGNSYFSRRGETASARKKPRSKHKEFLRKAVKVASLSKADERKNLQRIPTVTIHPKANILKNKPYVIPLIPNDKTTDKKPTRPLHGA